MVRGKLEFHFMFGLLIEVNNFSVSSRFGMSSLIIKDIKYQISRSLPLVISELLPQNQFMITVCHVFLSFLIFVTFCRYVPSRCDLEKV